MEQLLDSTIVESAESLNEEVTNGITRAWLRAAARQTQLPVCLRSQLMKKSMAFAKVGSHNSGRTLRSDFCQECGLNFDTHSAIFSMRERKVKRCKRKRKLIFVKCAGCKMKSAFVQLSSERQGLNRHEPQLIPSRLSMSSTTTEQAVVEKPKSKNKANISFVSSRASISSISSKRLSSTPSSKSRKQNRVNQLRRMVANNSSPAATLSDFLKSISNN